MQNSRSFTGSIFSVSSLTYVWFPTSSHNIKNFLSFRSFLHFWYILILDHLLRISFLRRSIGKFPNSWSSDLGQPLVACSTNWDEYSIWNLKYNRYRQLDFNTFYVVIEVLIRICLRLERSISYHQSITIGMKLD